METVMIKIGGMSCQGCVKTVTGVLHALAGVENAEVSLAAQEARVRFDSGKISASSLRTAIEEAGFDVL